jgi:hypothetical protein
VYAAQGAVFDFLRLLGGAITKINTAAGSRQRRHRRRTKKSSGEATSATPAGAQTKRRAQPCARALNSGVAVGIEHRKTWIQKTVFSKLGAFYHESNLGGWF